MVITKERLKEMYKEAIEMAQHYKSIKVSITQPEEYLAFLKMRAYWEGVATTLYKILEEIENG